MALLIHILIAFSSIVFTTYLFVSPSSFKFRVSYLFVFFTITSGSILIVLTPTYMVHACMAGLGYTIAVFFGIIAARQKFARQQV